MADKKAECRIKYILVEAITTKCVSGVAGIHVGLLKGYKINDPAAYSSAQEKFIMLSSEKEPLEVLSLETYNILSIEASDGATKTLTLFRAAKIDQVNAFEMLRDLCRELVEEGRIDADSLDEKRLDDIFIDTETYTDVPENYKEKTGVEKKVNEVKKVGVNNQDAYNYGCDIYGHHGYNGYGATKTHTRHVTHYNRAKGDEVPTVFNNAKNKTTKAKLKKMKTMVVGIRKKTFDIPDLPLAPGEKKEEKKAEVKAP